MWRWLIGLLSWAHLQLIEPIVRWWEEVVLGSWEEWLLALVRQGFEETTRFLNGLGSWFLSLFNQHSYREQLRRTWQENSWQQWWGEVSTRPSTLNALVANLVAQQQQQVRQNHQHHQAQPPLFSERQHPDGSLGSVPSAAGGNSRTAECGPSGLGVSNNLPDGGVMPGALGVRQELETRPSIAGAVGSRSQGGWWPRQQRGLPKRFGRARWQGNQITGGRADRPAVFVQQSGMGILDELAKRRHGLIEDAKMAAQLAVSRAFELARTTVRAILFLPSRDSISGHQLGWTRRAAAVASDGEASGSNDSGVEAGRVRHEGPPSGGSVASSRGGYPKRHLQRSKSAHVNIAELAYKPGAGAGAASASMSRRGIRRSRSFGRLSSGVGAFGHQAMEAPSDALSVIRAAGYPHELHTITTDDGYLLRLERIPRPGAKDVVFFMHGVLDTSMAWVSGGVTGSQAFAAWEAGFDVWLGNSRGNAPRQHQDPSCRGRRYWQYNINHMGMYDIGAQLDHIHNTKCAELGAGSVTLDLDHLGPLAGSFLGEGAGGGAADLRRANGGVGTLASSFLPSRATSTASAQQPLVGQEGTLRVAGRGAVRMRHSNSDGNLCRLGSNSSSSVISCNTNGHSCVVTSSAPEVAPVPMRTEDGPKGANPGVSDAAGADGRPPQPSPPSTPPPASAHPGRSVTPSVSVSAASLGRVLSSQSSLSPTPSCDDDDRISGSIDGGEGCDIAVEQSDPPCVAQAESEQLQVEHVKAPAGPSNAEGTPSASFRGCKSGRSSQPSPASPACLRSAAASIRHNAVTLAVASPRPDPTLPALAPASGDGGSTATMPSLTTFTLEAKTRTHFGAARSPLSAAAQYDGATAFGTDTHLQTRAGVPPGNKAVSVLDAVGSVLGPAADAVTAAMASAAATAGAAIATAAHSASQLLQPSPQRAGTPAAAQPTVGLAGGQPSASPFAGAGPRDGAQDPLPAICASAQDVDVEQRGCTAAATVMPAQSLPGVKVAVDETDPAPDVAEGHTPPQVPSQLAALPTDPRAGGVLRTTTAATVTAPISAFRTTEAASLSPSSASGTPFRRVQSTDQLSKRHYFSKGSILPGMTNPTHTAFASAAALVAPERQSSDLGHDSSFGGPQGPGCNVQGLSSAGSSGLQGGQLPTTVVDGQCVANGVGSPGDTGPDGLAPRIGTGAGKGAAPAPACPYKLRCVAHSLGGMSVLIHLINRLREGRSHHVSRLLLLTPAGFHRHYPKVAQPIIWVMPIITRVLRAVFGSKFSFPLYIPTPLARAFTFKLLLSASRIPGMGELLRMCYKAMLDGDISQWDRALQMPHYSAEDMPAISVDQVLHLVQLVASDSFQLYDYGSPAANTAHYGAVTPPDVSREYWRLDLPVHLVAGRRDGIIPPPNILRHLEAMRSQGVAVSYREFDFGHLDFTFGVKEELRMYLMKVLRL